MYIPLSKYSEPKYTRGSELQKKDGTFYVGWYFTDLAGNFFAGKKPSNNTISLSVANHELTDEVPNKEFTGQYIQPTEADHNNGFFIRYFLQDKRSKKIIEVKKEKFDFLKSFAYITSLELEWLLTSPIENISKGPYIYFGSSARNKETVMNQTIIDFPKNYFKNYYQFIREEDVEITQKQISDPKFDPIIDKEDRVQENLFTEGGEYLIKGTNKEYVGRYHIHPEKGAMVGGKHTRLPHDSLVRIDPTNVQPSTQLDTGSQEFTPSVTISGGTGFTAGSSGGGGSSGY